MTKNLLSILLFFIFCVNCNAQINLHIQEVSRGENSIKLLIAAKNISEVDSVLFYVPRDKSVFMALINIVFQENETGKIHEYYPSDEILDIDRLWVSKHNSVLLNPNSSHIFEEEIDLMRIAPFLKKERKYLLSVNLSYEYGNLETDLGHKIFKGSANSNIIEITN